MPTEIRNPIAAGTFYAADPLVLRRQIQSCFQHPLGPGQSAEPVATNPLAVVSPHAGYAYSGPIAAHAYQTLVSRQFDLVIVVGPNHSLVGPAVAVPSARIWRTPLGDLPIDTEAALALCANPWVRIDDSAHQEEHSIEVQLPFLQYVLGDEFRLLPIAIHDQGLHTSRMLGRALSPLLLKGNVALVASTDFTHYESHESATRKDGSALLAIERLDVDELAHSISANRVTMCGPGAVIAAIEAAKECGATRGRLLRYATSGEISGDYGFVVGYAALALV